ncbi:MAG: carbohydrate kinase family protein [Candidatus Moranbacteria bacterium]|jgi:sugar/nucleoside kinase (ribokinase family)|nr:carbohydrate kinase family protein [Candidatus Moranbacteria bacterium]
MWFSKKNAEIICVGSVSKDIFFPTDEGIVIETPEDITAKQKVAFELGGKYRVKDRFEAVGGVAANVAHGLARLGQNTALYSCVGDDEMGQFIEASLRKEGIATDLIRHLPDAKTDLSAIIVLTQNGERTIFHNRDANERLVVHEEKFVGAKWLFVSALNGDWKHNLALLLHVKEAQCLSLALNPGQHNIKEDAKTILETLPMVDVLLLNKDEAIELLLQLPSRPADSELNDELFLLEKLVQAGAKKIAMTDGKRGAWGTDGTEYWHCPIYTRDKVVDSTGAGDAFGSGFFSAHLMGKDLPVALSYGMANSGSVIGFYGAVEGLLVQNEIDDLIKNITPQRLR